MMGTKIDKCILCLNPCIDYAHVLAWCRFALTKCPHHFFWISSFRIFAPTSSTKSYVTRLKSEPERPTPHSLRRIHNTHTEKWPP